MRADTPEQSFDSSRFVKTAIGWYALTREQSDLGPFPSKEEAIRALSRHLQIYKGIHNRAADHQYTGFTLHDPETCAKTNCGLCAEASILRQSMIAAP